MAETNTANEPNNLESSQSEANQSTSLFYNLEKDPILKQKLNELEKRNFELSELPQLIKDVNSNDRYKQHYGVIGIRRILSIDRPPIQPVIDSKIVPKLIEFMRNDEELRLQYEAAWVLTNIAAGTTQQTQHIIDKGALPCFIQLLKSEETAIAEQAIWAIGNISSDSANFRDMILKWGSLPPLIKLVETTSKKIVIGNGIWAIANLCRGRPLPEISLVESAIPIICSVIQRDVSDDILTDATWALASLSRTADKIQPVIDTGVVPSLIRRLDSELPNLLLPCLRTIGNIFTGNEEEVNAVIEVPDLLSKLFNLIEYKRKAIRQEVCLIIANITAGSSNHIEFIFSVPQHIESVVNIALNGVPDVAREAVRAISNMTKNCTQAQIQRLIEQKVLDCFDTLLDSEDSKILEAVLKGIQNILDMGATLAHDTDLPENPYKVLIEEKGGIEKIERLQHHANNDIHLKALKIIEDHFEG